MTADPALLEADETARVTALDVARSFIVQAPAGSGKTELLIQRYLRLLSVVDQPEEILAITFTRKATLEMQSRVLEAMREARTAARATEPHQQVTLEAARRALLRDERREWRLLESPQRMRIQTIDALNAAIARSLPIGSGLGAAAEVVADETARSIYRRAAAATLDWLVSDGDEATAVEQLLVHLDNSSPLYLDHIARMLESRDQWLAITGTGTDRRFDEPAVRTRLERMISDQVSGHLRGVRSLFPAALAPALARVARYAAANLQRETGPEHALQALTALQELPPARESGIGAWHALADFLLTRDGAWRRTVNRTIGLPPGDEGQKAEMLSLLEALAGHEGLAAALHRVRQLPAPRYPEEQWTILLALIRVLPLAVAELRRIFAEQRVTDYIEVAIAAHAALGGMDEPGDIALLLDYGISHLLIDEMQDTSRAQYELLEKLVAGWQPGDGRTLFCVGDPMQSIYRFRNAEVGEFLLAREQGVGGVPLESVVLRRNFRSGERLVRWFNEVFADVFPAADDIAAGAIAYSESVPVEQHRSEGEVCIHPVVGSEPAPEAEQGLAVVRRCLADHPGDSVALLVRSRTQLPPLLAALRAAGINYQAVDIDRLTDLPEILDLLALTRALCHRSDRTAWLALLRGPWVGLTWADLHALVVNDRRRTVWELLHDETRVAALSEDGAARVTALLGEFAPYLDGDGTSTLRDTVEQAWFRLGGPGLLRDTGQVDNVYRFLDVLARLETAGTLADVADLEARLDQEHVATGGAPDARLQIMTMHRAKGLQFDHVVLFGLGRRASPGNKPVLSWLNVPDADGGRDFLISPLGARTQTESDPLHDLIEASLRAKDELEQDRLLYVACTRARRSLHLIGHVAVSADGRPSRGPLPGSLLHRIWPAVEPQFERALAAAAGALPDGAPRADLRVPVLDRLPRMLPRPELPPLPARAREHAPGPEQPVDYRWVGSTARHAGSIVHRCLQQLADGRLDADSVRDAEIISLAGRWAGELGVPADRIAAVRERARVALRQVLKDPKGRWLLGGPGHAELPLTGIHQGQIVSVVIDRVRIDEAGTHWVVDYKAGSHEGGDLDRFLAQERERYRPQLERYAALYRRLVDQPVRAALYFPLLQRFVEVPLDATTG